MDTIPTLADIYLTQFQLLMQIEERMIENMLHSPSLNQLMAILKLWVEKRVIAEAYHALSVKKSEVLTEQDASILENYLKQHAT